MHIKKEYNRFSIHTHSDASTKFPKLSRVRFFFIQCILALYARVLLLKPLQLFYTFFLYIQQWQRQNAKKKISTLHEFYAIRSADIFMYSRCQRKITFPIKGRKANTIKCRVAAIIHQIKTPLARSRLYTGKSSSNDEKYPFQPCRPTSQYARVCKTLIRFLHTTNEQSHNDVFSLYIYILVLLISYKEAPSLLMIDLRHTRAHKTL